MKNKDLPMKGQFTKCAGKLCRIFCGLTTIILFTGTTGWSQTTVATDATVADQIKNLSDQVRTSEGKHDIELGRLENRIEALNNGMFAQIAIPVGASIAAFFFGFWSLKSAVRSQTDATVKAWMEKEAPARSDAAVNEFLKKNFPGNINYLWQAAKEVAYDVELRQSIRIVVVGTDERSSKRLVELLGKAGFVKVDFSQLKIGMPIPDADVLLLDRFTLMDSKNELDTEGVRRFIDNAANSAALIHYMGAQIPNLKDIIRPKDAMSSAEFSLVPNIVDQLKYAFPQPQSPKNR